PVSEDSGSRTLTLFRRRTISDIDSDQQRKANVPLFFDSFRASLRERVSLFEFLCSSSEKSGKRAANRTGNDYQTRTVFNETGPGVLAVSFRVLLEKAYLSG